MGIFAKFSKINFESKLFLYDFKIPKISLVFEIAITQRILHQSNWDKDHLKELGIMYQISLENRKWEYLLNFQKLTLKVNFFLYDFKIPF